MLFSCAGYLKGNVYKSYLIIFHKNTGKRLGMIPICPLAAELFAADLYDTFKTKEVNVNKPVQNTVSGDVKFEVSVREYRDEDCWLCLPDVCPEVGTPVERKRTEVQLARNFLFQQLKPLKGKKG
jgi:hypothetical protein